MIPLELQEITINHSLPSNTLSEVFGFVCLFLNFYKPHVICSHTRLIFQTGTLLPFHYCLSTISKMYSFSFNNYLLKFYSMQETVLG